MRRKIKRDAVKRKRKERRNHMKNALRQFESTPTSCSLCSENFTVADKSNLDTWKIISSPAGVLMCCPACQERHRAHLEQVS